MQSKRFITFIPIVIAWALVSSTICAAQDYSKIIRNFSGNWKENEAKRKMGAGLSLRFRHSADGGLEELRIGRNGFTSTWSFDGKTNPVIGPDVVSGMTDSAKVLDNLSLSRPVKNGMVTRSEFGGSLQML